MQPQMKQSEPPKPQSRGKMHYYMCISDEHERRAAQAWLDSRFGEDGARLVTELRIDRLREDSSLSVLVRRAPAGKKHAPHAVPLRVDEHGIREPEERDGFELAKGMDECKPLACRDFWVSGTSEDREGEINTARFLEELGKACTPACVKWREDSRTLRLGWA